MRFSIRFGIYMVGLLWITLFTAIGNTVAAEHLAPIKALTLSWAFSCALVFTLFVGVMHALENLDVDPNADILVHSLVAILLTGLGIDVLVTGGYAAVIPRSTNLFISGALGAPFVAYALALYIEEEHPAVASEIGDWVDALRNEPAEVIR